MRPLDFEIALEVLHGLCEQMGAVGVERERVMRYDDDKLVALFDVYSLLHGLFQEREAIASFIRQSRQIKRMDGPCFRGALTELLFGGDVTGIQLAREYVRYVAGGC